MRLLYVHWKQGHHQVSLKVLQVRTIHYELAPLQDLVLFVNFKCKKGCLTVLLFYILNEACDWTCSINQDSNTSCCVG